MQKKVKIHSKFESYLKQVTSVGGVNEVNEVIKEACTLTQERDVSRLNDNDNNNNYNNNYIY